MKGIVKAKDIVNEALFLTGRPQSDYGLVFQHLVNGYRELNTYTIPTVKYKKVEMDGQRMVDYPDDLVELRYVFVPYHGEIKPLTRKPLVPTTSLMYGERTRDLERGEGEPIAISTVGNTARPHNVFGYYMQDDRNRWIIFVTDKRTEVVLAYSTSGLEAEDTYIPVLYKMPLLYWVKWQDAFMTNKPMSQIEMAERTYEKSLRMLDKPVITYEDFAEAWIQTKAVGR